jgi:hypothetical protein
VLWDRTLRGKLPRQRQLLFGPAGGCRQGCGRGGWVLCCPGPSARQWPSPPFRLLKGPRPQQLQLQDTHRRLECSVHGGHCQRKTQHHESSHQLHGGHGRQLCILQRYQLDAACDARPQPRPQPDAPRHDAAYMNTVSSTQSTALHAGRRPRGGVRLLAARFGRRRLPDSLHTHHLRSLTCPTRSIMATFVALLANGLVGNTMVASTMICGLQCTKCILTELLELPRDVWRLNRVITAL